MRVGHQAFPVSLIPRKIKAVMRQDILNNAFWIILLESFF